MRILTDITGKELRLNKIEGEDALVGILEGSPYMIRKMRIFAAKNYMNGEGQFFSDVELLEREVETLERDCDQLPARELWLAEISTGNKFNDGKFSTNRLKVQWYQECEDPFKRIGEIVAELNFADVCRSVEWEA